MFGKNLHRRSTAVRLWLYPPQMQHIRLPQLLRLRENSIFLPYCKTHIALNKSTNFDDNLSAKHEMFNGFSNGYVSFWEAQRFFPAAFLAKSILRVKSEASSGEPASGFSPLKRPFPKGLWRSILFGKFTWRLKILNFWNARISTEHTFI